MRRAFAASEGGNTTELGQPEDQDAKEQDREWEIAKLQEEIRLAQKDFAKVKTKQDGGSPSAKDPAKQAI